VPLKTSICLIIDNYVYHIGRNSTSPYQDLDSHMYQVKTRLRYSYRPYKYPHIRVPKRRPNKWLTEKLYPYLDGILTLIGNFRRLNDIVWSFPHCYQFVITLPFNKNYLNNLYLIRWRNINYFFLI